jgi:uncharacterized protein DUF6484
MSPKRNPAATVEANAAATTAAAGGLNMKVGRLVAGSAPGKLMVDFDGNAHGPLAARTVVALDQRALDEAIAVRRTAVLLFENGDARLPIVVGLVAPDPGASLLGALLAPASAADPVAHVPAARTAPVEARVDGKRVVVEGQEEVVLKCGEASITLKRDGKVILRGAYVETHARGVNRIKGGSVKIN